MADVSQHSNGDQANSKPHAMSEPLISQEELDLALAAELEARKARRLQAAAADTQGSPPRPAFQAPPPTTLPPDLGLIGQDELDNVVASSTSGKPKGSEAPAHESTQGGDSVGQDEIDLLLRAVQDSGIAPPATPTPRQSDAATRLPETAATPDEAGGALDQDSMAAPLISQDELDLAMAAEMAARKARMQEAAAKAEAQPAPPRTDFQAPPPTTLPPDLGLIGQDELDNVVASSKSGKQKGSEAPAHESIPGGDSVGQDEIDSLLRAVQDSGITSPAAPAAKQSDASTRIPETAAILDEVGGALDQDSTAAPLISQDELDLAMAAEMAARKARMQEAAAKAEAQPAPPRADFQAPPPTTLPPDLGLIGQDELDDIVSSTSTGRPKVSEAPALESVPGGDSVGQDEIDRLLRAVQDSGIASPAAPAPRQSDAATSIPETAAIPDEVGGALDQKEIDRLLHVGQEPEARHRDAPAKDLGTATQDEIDRLLRQEAERVARSATEPAKAEPPARHEEPAGPMGQSEIDSLLQSIAGTSASMAKARTKATPEPVGEPVTTGAGGIIPADIPPSADTLEPESAQLSQSDLDALLASMTSEDVLDNREIDAPLAPMDTPAGTGMDETLGRPTTAGTAPDLVTQATAKERPEADPVERAKRAASESQVGSENIAAAVPLAESKLDSVLAGITKEPEASAAGRGGPGLGVPDAGLAIPSVDELSEELGENLAAASSSRNDMAVKLTEAEIAEIDLIPRPEPSPEDASAALARGFRRSLSKHAIEALTGLAGTGTLKTWTSLAAAILCTLGTFMALQAIRERAPGSEAAPGSGAGDAAGLLRSASSLIDMRQYAEAKKILDPLIGDTPTHSTNSEALYLHIVARYHEMPAKVTDMATEQLHQEINHYVTLAGDQQKVGNVLRWKADLYERAGADIAALDTYRSLLSTRVDVSGTDDTLIRAARLTDKLARLDEEKQFVLRLLEQYPESAHVPEATLLLGNVYASEGNSQDAERIFRQVALSEFDSPIGAQAVAHLAEMALTREDYAGAIRELENRLETATTIAGNETIYLLLAKAHRSIGDPAKAEEVLRELINFFPESERTPDAFVELSRTLDELGNRREALKVAMQASQRFPGRADVLVNEGELLQRSGKDNEAAERFLEAAEAGGDDAKTLFAAGLAFERVNELAKARDAFEHLLMVSPQSTEAFYGNLHLANVLLQQGQAEAALNRLTDLAEATTGKAQQAPVLAALGGLYSDLGFVKHAAETYATVAAQSSDPEILAQTVRALIEAGDAGTALAIANRVDPQALAPETAYAFLCAHGKALLRMDAALALEKMERAYKEHPEHRTEAGDNDLLQAYLVTGQTARARALVMDLKTYVSGHPDQAPRLQRTAVQWADALYEHADYTAAAEAYALAAASAPDGKDTAWAKFQQANARLNLNEFAEGVSLLDEVAASDAPFAEDARLKAEYARLELRLRSRGPAPSSAQMGG